MRLFGLLVGGSFLLWGCGGASCPILRFERAESLLEHHERLLAWAQSVQAEALGTRYEAGAPIERSRLRGELLWIVARPALVRFDVMTQLGPAATLTSDGKRFALWERSEGRWFVGAPCPSNVARLLGIPVEASLLVRVLFGEAPRWVSSAVADEIECAEGRYRVRRRASDGRSEEFVYEVRSGDEKAAPEAQRLRLRHAWLRNPQGEIELEFEWSDHRLVADPKSQSPTPQGVALPHRIRMRFPKKAVEVDLKIQRIEINGEIPEDAFVQEIAPGFESEFLACEGGP
ncbi:MAG: hypothetical protein N2515_08345 [Deltaproteobacteria bacterium]|nr:hypothetical protein [Deltaproteobacteria bacterium]